MPALPKLSRYDVLSQIGSGGMGDVFLAHDRLLDRKVAIKFIRQELAGAEANERFLAEARTIAKFDHPNICSIYEVGHEDHCSFIAMQYVDGETLAYRISRGRLTVSEACDVCTQVASTLAEAARLGVIHRDLKPQNIMLTSRQQVKVLDFGLAKTLDDSAAALTAPGRIVGTLPYMSPEQINGEPLDIRSDLYSLGVILYEMLTGRQPFARTTARETIAAVLMSEPPKVPPSQLPPAMDAVVRRLLAKNREDRYPSAAALLDALRDVAGGSPTAPLMTASGRTRHCLAILPFANVSSDADNEYFCEGLAEEVMHGLSKLEAIDVISRGSTSLFGPGPIDVGEVGRKLGADAVIEGSVRRSGDRLRVLVRLADVSTGRQLWSERFDMELSDIFAVQDKIAVAVVEALRIRLSGDEKERLLAHYRNDAGAQHLFLKGRFFFNKSTPDGLLKAVELFNDALAIDPKFADAYAALAASEILLGMFFRPPLEWMPRARTHAMRALELDPHSAEGRGIIGLVALVHEWDWNAAAEQLSSPSGLNSRVIETFGCTAHLLEGVGRGRQAILEVRKALELNPLSAALLTELGCSSYYERHYDDALRYFLDAVDLDQFSPIALWGLGRTYDQKGQPAEAVKLFTARWPNLTDTPEMILGELGYAHAIAGNRDDAQRVVEELDRRGTLGWVDPYFEALVHLGLHNDEAAVASLQRAIAVRSAFIPSIANDPKWDRFHANPRFIEVLGRLNIPISSGALLARAVTEPIDQRL